MLWFTLSIHAQVQLSEESKISVLTCSQGEELYAKFGHSALRVSDPLNNMDWVFNYGTFSFNTPNFYLKFANGKLNYILSISKYKHFLPEYFKDNRRVTEQILNLDLENRQRVFDALMINYKPENRYYKYDFFYDNCATRIVDIIADNIEGKLALNVANQKDKEISFRAYLHHYLKTSPWTETGLNLILGLPADKVATLRESTYLPDFLLIAFDQAQFISPDGKQIPLVQEKKELLAFDDVSEKFRFWTSPFFIFAILLMVVASISLLFQSKAFMCFDRTLFFVAGVVGVLICYLWFVTDHSVTRFNFNILWSFPSLLFLAFSRGRSKAYRLILKLNIAGIVLFLVGWKFIPQSFPLATIPIALLLGFRLLMRFKTITIQH